MEAETESDEDLYITQNVFSNKVLNSDCDQDFRELEQFLYSDCQNEIDETIFLN
jgi:hypothetical protein